MDIALEAYARVRAPSQRSDVAPSDVYGWLSVNAPGDYNKLHAPDSADRWSGVLYLAVPDLTNAPGVSDDAGCLGVRASPPPRGVRLRVLDAVLAPRRRGRAATSSSSPAPRFTP